jgi:F-type H+-transporting ATPase subunit epsilon
MASTFRLRIVTPERELLDEQAEEVVAPGGDGEIGVLPDHVGLLTTLLPGRLAYKVGGRQRVIAIFGGYAEVTDNVMTVLADGAQPVEEIDGDAAKREAAELEARWAACDPTAPEAVELRRQLDRARARVTAIASRS